MSLAIIPARGGSKRIPRKNIRPFNGRPIISYAVDVARASGLFDHIIVSTEDEEVASVARECGAETPFIRPNDLANDETPTVPVVVHGIQKCKDLGWSFEHVCCIYPAVPLLEAEDLREALEMLSANRSDYCVSIAKFPSVVQRALKRLDGGEIRPFYSQYEMTRTQDLDAAYYDVGQFYWGKTNAWLRNPKLHHSSVGYVIPSWRAIDIDTPEDWLRAELLYRCLKFSDHLVAGNDSRRR